MTSSTSLERIVGMRADFIGSRLPVRLVHTADCTPVQGDVFVARIQSRGMYVIAHRQWPLPPAPRRSVGLCVLAHIPPQQAGGYWRHQENCSHSLSEPEAAEPRLPRGCQFLSALPAISVARSAFKTIPCFGGRRHVSASNPEVFDRDAGWSRQ